MPHFVPNVRYILAHRKCEIKKRRLPPESSASESAAGLTEICFARWLLPFPRCGDRARRPPSPGQPLFCEHACLHQTYSYFCWISRCLRRALNRHMASAPFPKFVLSIADIPDTNFGNKGALANISSSAAYRFEVPNTNSRQPPQELQIGGTRRAGLPGNRICDCWSSKIMNSSPSF